MGEDISEFNIEKLILGAEPWSDKMREQIERIYDARAYDIPGLTEMGGVGTVGFECPLRNGLHMWEDNYIVEIVDENGEPVSEGEEGEVVYTALNREAMPLIRYKSGEVSYLIGEECECGINHLKIGRIKGRTDDMVIYKGAKFYPSDIESILAQYGVKHYKIVVSDGGIEVIYEGDGSLVGKILKDISEFIGIRPKISAVGNGTLERFEGKAKRLVRV